jgi:phytoene dehydrogenase-like protein
METYDVIIIGSGHNALVSAAYLTHAGRSVLVVERNDRPGGFVRSDEILPGFTYDPFSSTFPLFVTGPAYADFEEALTVRGLRFVDTDLPTGVSMEDGTTAVLPRTPDAAAEEAERLAPGDGAAFAQMLAAFNPYANDVFSLFNQDLTSLEARRIIESLMRNGDGPGCSAFAASLFDTARTVVSPFRSAAMRAMLGSWVTHMSKGPDEVGSGIWAKLFVLGLMGGGAPIPEGGAGRLAEALARLVTDLGGVIVTDTPVRRILVEGGRAVGVVTADGAACRARESVIASVNPDQLYLTLLADEHVPAPLRAQARGFRYGRGCVQIHLALSEPPRWADQRFDRVGQPFLTDSLDGLALAVAQGRADMLPAKPTFTVDCPTLRDPSRAPAGKAVLRVQVQDVPTRPSGDAAGRIDVGDGSWTRELTERFTERVLGIVGRHIPNVPDTVVGRVVTTPETLAAYNPNAGPGDPFGGAQDLAQSYLFRPLPGQPGHQTFIPNLYTLGAATWPGSGVSGSSGYIVAQKLLRASCGDGQRQCTRRQPRTDEPRQP